MYIAHLGKGERKQKNDFKKLIFNQLYMYIKCKTLGIFPLYYSVMIHIIMPSAKNLSKNFLTSKTIPNKFVFNILQVLKCILIK